MASQGESHMDTHDAPLLDGGGSPDRAAAEGESRMDTDDAPLPDGAGSPDRAAGDALVPDAIVASQDVSPEKGDKLLDNIESAATEDYADLVQTIALAPQDKMFQTFYSLFSAFCFWPSFAPSILIEKFTATYVIQGLYGSSPSSSSSSSSSLTSF